jgi:hypothetical protein
MEKPKLTVIDGSSQVYSACHNTSVKEEDTDNFIKYKETLDFYMNSILEATEAEYYIIFTDESTSYRKQLFSEFKADRKKKRPLKFSADLLLYAREELGFYSHPDLEADDLCLIVNNLYKDKYDITISSIDSDLRQENAKFFNPKIFRKPDYNIKDGFETIDHNTAQFNLWRSVLTKGHNNKVDYLESCGNVCAETYLKFWKPEQYKYAVLKAFTEGIHKDNYPGIKRNIKGYGLQFGIDKFSKSFQQSYLFRDLKELEFLEIDLLDLPDFQTFNTAEYDKYQDL